MSIKTCIDKITSELNISQYKLAQDLEVSPAFMWYHLDCEKDAPRIKFFRKLKSYANKHNIELSSDELLK